VVRHRRQAAKKKFVTALLPTGVPRMTAATPNGSPVTRCAQWVIGIQMLSTRP
jgi:hypothetical protein